MISSNLILILWVLVDSGEFKKLKKLKSVCIQSQFCAIQFPYTVLYPCLLYPTRKLTPLPLKTPSAIWPLSVHLQGLMNGMNMHCLFSLQCTLTSFVITHSIQHCQRKQSPAFTAATFWELFWKRFLAINYTSKHHREETGSSNLPKSNYM